MPEKKYNPCLAKLFPHDSAREGYQGAILTAQAIDDLRSLVMGLQPGERLVVKVIAKPRTKVVAAIEVESPPPYDAERAEIDAEAAQGSFDF